MKLQFAKEKPCGMKPDVATKGGDEEKISEEAVASTLRRALSFFSTLQAEDGHWPSDYGGPLFLLPGLVRLHSHAFITNKQNFYRKLI